MLRQQSYAIISESRKKDVCDEFSVLLDLILLHFECTTCVQLMKNFPFHSIFCLFDIFPFVIKCSAFLGLIKLEPLTTKEVFLPHFLVYFDRTDGLFFQTRLLSK